MATTINSDLPAPPARRMLEIKEALSGGERRFDLERWFWTPEVVVGRWVAPADNRFGLAQGAYSWGVWWSNRPYGAYRIHKPDGSLRLYRLDVLEDACFEEMDEGFAVRWRDLLLDVLITPDGEVEIEDEDEVAAAIEAQELGAAQRWRIDWVRAAVQSHTPTFIGRIDRAVDDAIRSVRQLQDL